jgi:hypothetical protein
MDEDHLVILRLCNRDSDKYGRVTNKRFWKEIAREFKGTTGKEHDSLWRVVDSIVKKRRQFLEDLESGTQDLIDEKTIQTDTWISTLDARKVQEDADERSEGASTKRMRLQRDTVYRLLTSGVTNNGLLCQFWRQGLQ